MDVRRGNVQPILILLPTFLLKVANFRRTSSFPLYVALFWTQRRDEVNQKPEYLDVFPKRNFRVNIFLYFLFF